MGRGYIYIYIYIYTALWWGDLRERPLGRPRRRWEDNIKMDLQKVRWKDWGEWTGLIWLRIGSSGGHL